MSQSFDVLIVGGGITGLTAALAMAKRQQDVGLIDAGSLSTEPSNSVCSSPPRVYAINKTSQHVLNQLGVWQRLTTTQVSPYQHMHVWDAVSSACIDFDSRAIAESSLGAIIEEEALRQALLQEISQQPNIHLFADSPIDLIQNNDLSIQVASKQMVWQGQLLMIADGASSPCRDLLQIEMTSWPYQQNAIVATVHTDKSHQRTAYQVFNPDGPLAFLPLVDPNECSIVWSTDEPHAQHLMSLDEQTFNEELTDAFAAKLGPVRLTSARHQFPLQMRHVKEYVGTRWLLLGDAAHTIHPLAGLGLNIGFADLASWLRYYDLSEQPLADKKRLGAYQRERKNAVWQTIMLMEGFKRLFQNKTKSVGFMRALGLNVCNRSSIIKRLFIEHAAGTKLG